MPDSLPLSALLGIFAVAAAAVWYAGIYLSDATDALAARFGLGEALGGMILLAIVTNLPEIAIVASASARGAMEVAVGNILGGIAIQTVVLAALDVFGLGREAPLTLRAESPTLVLEGALVVAVLALTIIGHHMPAELIVARMTPAALLIAAFWIAGLYVIGETRRRFGDADGRPRPNGRSTARHALVFAAGALVTLAAGVVLEVSGEHIAARLGMGGALFGATVLAGATALPEVSTGLESMRLKDYRMAVSDIFGGNAFLPVLFLMATLLSGKAVLPNAKPTDLYLTGLGILLTVVYIAGLVIRPQRQLLRMGLDSFVVVLLYALGVLGLFFMHPDGG
ncbi:sodium/calcium exchanger membrane region [Mizugakiibacter sediminis]|uniref:Sodium/calcium exchanger membrane region n=1 Tax=Mizugakiibacter sediminis TaxID=1475481 RepID=A0A0K8QMS6_9GAMM|nr:sodium:proton exchanger [Mizugakiibacter sediminis]GAP66158.1 sodium/calcium exchanger membrane region [Mizugakiibacter sediminis]